MATAAHLEAVEKEWTPGGKGELAGTHNDTENEGQDHVDL